jgi:hypothetical protein
MNVTLLSTWPPLPRNSFFGTGSKSANYSYVPPHFACSFLGLTSPSLIRELCSRMDGALLAYAPSWSFEKGRIWIGTYKNRKSDLDPDRHETLRSPTLVHNRYRYTTSISI